MTLALLSVFSESIKMVAENRCTVVVILAMLMAVITGLLLLTIMLRPSHSDCVTNNNTDDRWIPCYSFVTVGVAMSITGFLVIVTLLVSLSLEKVRVLL